MELCIMNLLHSDKLCASISVHTFYNIYDKTCRTTDVRSGTQEIGFTTMTMVLSTLSCPFRNFWPIMV